MQHISYKYNKELIDLRSDTLAIEATEVVRIQIFRVERFLKIVPH